MKTSLRCSFILCFLMTFAAATPLATVFGESDWPNWRGVHLNGNAGEGSYPVRWSENEGILWKVEIPGRGASTPIVIGDSILLTAGVESQNALLAYDRSGKLKWQTLIGSERPGKNKKASGANSSAISDGQYVYSYFKSGDLACCDLKGKIVWRRNLQQEFGEDTLWWDLGTSPVLTDEAVIVAVMQSGPSFIVAFDKKSGQQLWKIDRMLDANQESNQAYTTPTFAKTESGDVMLALGADHVTAHDPKSGEELWRVGGFNPTNQQNYRCISSPIVVGDLVICPYARGHLVTAVRLGKGLSPSDRVAWQREHIGADVPTPTEDGKRLFFTTDKGEVTCVEAATGKTLWSGELPKNRSNYTSSPILAGGHLYLIREDGTCFVLKAGNEFKVVSENVLSSTTVATPVVSTPVFVDGKILIRTFDSLYCIGS